MVTRYETLVRLPGGQARVHHGSNLPRLDEGVLVIPEEKGVTRYNVGKWLSHHTEKKVTLD
jgi:hypothetical protein